MGTTRGVYNTWCKHVKQEPHAEAIGEGANLFWIGERKLEKVILFFHGESTSLSVSLMTYSCVVGTALIVRYGYRGCFPLPSF
jgi:hypothetical protein